MATDPAHQLAGIVVVVAADDARLVQAATALLHSGALVGIVTANDAAVTALADLPGGGNVGVPMAFHAEPSEDASLGRIAPHLEQRLGPVDVVVADPASLASASRVFGPDLARRGHGDVVLLDDDVVSSVAQAVRRTR